MNNGDGAQRAFNNQEEAAAFVAGLDRATDQINNLAHMACSVLGTLAGILFQKAYCDGNQLLLQALFSLCIARKIGFKAVVYTGVGMGFGIGVSLFSNYLFSGACCASDASQPTL